MIKIILIVLAVIIIGFVILVVTRPSVYRYSRSATIAASPAALFEQVNDLHNFQNWSPWAKLDSNATITYTGPNAGVGASFSWAGNNEVGEGSMTIVESRPGELVRCRMEFKKPMAGLSTADFSFKPEGDRTIVNWSLYGDNASFICKAVGLVMNCDKMCGEQFEQGLKNLAAIVELPPKQ